MDEKYHLAIKTAFASEFAFYLKAHNFHWNVEGPGFYMHHELFGDIYEEVFESIDTFAEQIRAVGAYVPGSFQRFSMLSQINDETEILDAGNMLQELYQDCEKMVSILKLVFDMCESNGDRGFSDFIASRIDAHKKHSWMLRASLK